jgi:transposase
LKNRHFDDPAAKRRGGRARSAEWPRPLEFFSIGNDKTVLQPPPIMRRQLLYGANWTGITLAGVIMALGRRNEERQAEFWVATQHLPSSPGHVFYEKLNELLAEGGFDEWVETLCESYYAKCGRPSIPPGVYFRMLLIGYFEGIGSQRGIAWRCSDSLSLRKFLGVAPTEESPEHSSLSVIRERLPHEVHNAVFTWVLKLAREKGLLDGKTVGVDSTTLEANAAMKSIVRRDTGEDWQEYVTGLMRDAGTITPTDTPTIEEMKRFDKSRKGKKVSNEDWESPSDPDSRIAKMKDGTTHLAYKAEHTVDLKTEMILSAEIYYATEGDTHTIEDTVQLAQVNLQESGSEVWIEDAVGDKGYHSAQTLTTFAEETPYRTYIAEPKLPADRSHTWTEKPPEQRDAVYANRRRIRGVRGKRLQRQRSEKVERTFAHVCETGGARRTWLQGIGKVHKRYLIAAAAHNLGRLMRELFGMGTPRGLQKAGEAVDSFLCAMYLALLAIRRVVAPLCARLTKFRRAPAIRRPERGRRVGWRRDHRNAGFSTGCYATTSTNRSGGLGLPRAQSRGRTIGVV